MTSMAKRVIWLLSCLTVLTAGVAAQQAARANALENRIEAEYQRAYYETVELVDDIADSLEKLMVTGSKAQKTTILSGIARQADSAQSDLAALPANLPVVSGSIHFCNQLGDFCRTLNERLLQGGEMEREDRETLALLASTCTALRDELTGSLAAGGESFSGGVNLPTLNDTQPAEALVSYPSLLYDGPFSDGRDVTELKALGSGSYDAGGALARARAFIGEDRINGCYVTGEGETPVPVWEITCLSDDGVLKLAVTKTGGQVLYMMDESDVTGGAYTAAGAMDLAQAFLKQKGYGEMEVSYWISDGNRVTVNFAARQDGVILYPDLIKVEMSLGSGRVIGFEATNWLGSHVPREHLTPALTAGEAEALLSSSLTRKRTRLCLIPLETGEALCYECLTELHGEEFLIYVDARTGEERKIYKVIEDAGGSLAV